MTDKRLMDDSALALALRNLYLAEVDRARREPRAALVPVRGRPRTRAKTWSPLAAAVVVLVVGVAAVGSQLGHLATSGRGQGSANPGGAPATGSPSPSAEASRSSVGPILAGFPETIGDEPVLRGTDAITHRIENSTDDTSFLVGGWFHKGGLNVPCLTGALWNWSRCSTIQLYEGAQGDAQHQGVGAVWIYPGDPRRIESETATAAVRPVVLRIHTHDVSCPTGLQNFQYCSSLPVLVEVVWVGPAG